jgi:protein SCO1/2
MKNLRPILWKGVVAGALVYAGILYFKENPIKLIPPIAPQETAAAAPTEVIAPAVGGDFTLTDQDGKPFDSKSLRGKYPVIFFGFTHCPDECPLALQKLNQSYDALDAPKKASIVPIFISVDPARDTPAVLKEYNKAFTMPLISLTGDQAAITAVEKLFKVYAAQQQKPETAAKADDYEVDHSVFIYLLGKDGKSLTLFPIEAPAQDIAKKLQALP